MKSSSLASESLTPDSESASLPTDQTELLQTELLQTEGFESLALEHQAEQPPAKPDRQAEVRIFLSTFLTIFLAELGDKTQVTTLLMSAESHAPWIVFAGAGTALVATSLLGVWLGCWLAKRVSAKTLETATGGLLLLVSVLLLWDVVHL